MCTPKSRINLINSNKEFNKFISRNSFNKNAKTNFDSEHFSIGSPLLNKSHDLIDRINLPNFSSTLVSSSKENLIKQKENKKMNDMYNFTTKIHTFLRPDIEKSLLKSSSMVSFDSNSLKDSIQEKWVNKYQKNTLFLNSKAIKLHPPTFKTNLKKLNDLSPKRLDDLKEKLKKLSNYTKYCNKSHFLFGNYSSPVKSMAKEFHEEEAVDHN